MRAYKVKLGFNVLQGTGVLKIKVQNKPRWVKSHHTSHHERHLSLVVTG